MAVAGLLVCAPSAHAQLGVSIDPTSGFPGDLVTGQVNVADVAAQCTTDLTEFQAKFEAVLAGPYDGGSPSGELFSRFFPGDEFVFENCDQAAYSMTGLVLFGVVLNLNGAAETAFERSFAFTFADILTQEPVGELGQFDPFTGEGSVTVPDLTPGLWAVAAACVEPVLDLDQLEAGIRTSGAFLESLGFPTCDINAPEFVEYIEQLLGPGTDIFGFLFAFGPEFLQPIVTPQALGVQLFTILEPAPIEIKVANAFRSRSKPGRINIRGSLQTGQFGPNDALDPNSDFSLRVTDGLNLDVTLDVDADTCTSNPRGRILCKDAAKTYQISFAPQGKVAGTYRLDIKLRQLDIGAPQVGPLTLELDYGIPRQGTAANCRVDAAKLSCKG
ncbi:MAG TPA: hypothetical protein VIS07_10005 [Candidatus Binatia bacterium]